MKDIENISIFGEYSQAENRYTIALLKILKLGGIELIEKISNELSLNFIKPQLNFYTQVASGNNSIYDGQIKSEGTLNVCIESKIVPNSINLEQLKKHQSDEKLLYITPDESKPQQLKNEDIPWISWEAMFKLLADFNESFNNEIFNYLLSEFEILLSNKNLISNNSFNTNNENVIIVAGREALSLAENLKLYIFQNHRKVKPCKYIAFYKDNVIANCFEIKKLDKNEDLKKHPKKEEILKFHPNESMEFSRNIFELSEKIQMKNVVINSSVDKNGNVCPYTYGQFRYTTYNKLMNAVSTNQL